jgi:signal transduction histidine kinase
MGYGVGLVLAVPLFTATLTSIGGASLPMGLLVPLAAGLGLVPYSLATLLDEDRVVRFVFKERYRRSQTQRLLSQMLASASSVRLVADAAVDVVHRVLGASAELHLYHDPDAPHLDPHPAIVLLSGRSYECAVDSDPAERDSDVTALSIPLRSANGHLGVLCVSADPNGNPLSLDDQLLLEGIADQLAIAIQRGLAFGRLQELNQDLANIVNARTAAIERKTRELNDLNKELESYSRALSHDLRSPLVGVTNALSLAAQEIEPQGNRLRRFVEMARRSAGMALGMVDAMFDMKRAVSDPEPVTAIDLEALLKDAVAEFEPELIKRGTQVSVDLSVPHVYGQRLKLLRVFRNLLGNAIKFTSQQATPKIAIGGQHRGAHVIVSIQDNGVGIPKRYRERIFDLFHRVPREESLPTTGLGAGLAIAKQILDQHNAHISVTSEEASGATFTVRFSNIVERNTRYDLAAARIVLIEDDNVLRQSVAQVLTEGGATVRAFATGEDALQVLLHHQPTQTPAAIVLDLGLPGMSGVDLLIRLRANESPCATTPIFVCSDPANVEALRKCRALGIHSFIAKGPDFLGTLLRELHILCVGKCNG